MQPFELFIGLRYTRSRQRNRFISFISLVSVIGIALGITVLITVLSVMNGFQREIRTRILSVASHVQITGPGEVLADWRATAAAAANNPEVVATAPYVSAQGLLSSGGAVRGAYVRGVLPEYELKVDDLSQHMKAGSLEALKVGDVVGATVKAELSVYILDHGKLTGADGISRPKTVNFNAKVLKVDPSYRLLTLRFTNGHTMTIKAGLNVALEKMAPGDDVVMRSSQITAIEIHQP